MGDPTLSAFGLLEPTPHEIELSRQAPLLTIRNEVTTIKRHQKRYNKALSWVDCQILN